MRARNYKSKASKERDNNVTSSNLITDSVYTTETNYTRFADGYGRGLNKYDDDYYNYFEGRSTETLTNIDDYTSASSSDERDSRKYSPGSRSEKIYSQRYSNSPTRQKRRNQSPREYGAQKEDTRKSKQKYRDRNRLESASEQNLGYRSRRSPKRDDRYIYDLSYEKYFEPAEKRVIERSLEHSKRERRAQERGEREFNDRKERVQKSFKQQRQYQVYAYENARPHNKVFARKAIDSGNSVLPSEEELKSHEYPVLAFKDKNKNTINARDSDMIYVPVVFIDNSNKKVNKKASPVSHQTVPQDNNNFQVFAANLGNKNYFETMGEANFQDTLSGSHNKQSLIKPTQSPNKYSVLNTESHIIESILNQTEYSYKPTDSNFSPKSGKLTVQPPVCREPSKFSKETTGIEKNPFGNNQKSIVYQVNVDVGTGIEHDSNQRSQAIPKHDHLLDDYPVTKDYIKVNGSEETKPPSLEKRGSVKPRRQSTELVSRNPSVFVDVITNDKISHSISDSKDAARHKSIVKDQFPNKNKSIPENSLDKNEAVGNQNTPEESPKKSMLEAKSGSLAIPFDIPREDGTDVISTQGLTRFSSKIGGSEKQVLARQSANENMIRQSNIMPLSRKSTVSHQSAVAKQPSISTARESQHFDKRISATQSRISPAKSQNVPPTTGPETVLESRKSLAQQATRTPEAQTQPNIPAKFTSIELRQSLMQTEKAVEGSPSDQRKSKDSTEHKTTSKFLPGTQQNVTPEQGLKEFTNTDFEVDHIKEPSLTKASLSRNVEVASARKSEITPVPIGDEIKEGDLSKSQAFDEKYTEERVSNTEKLTSVVNFSHDLQNTTTPERVSLNKFRINEGTIPNTEVKTSLFRSPRVEDSEKVANGRINEEKIHHTDVKKSLKSSPTVEDSGKVAQSIEPPSEPKKSELDTKPKHMVSRLFKSKSHSHESKATPSKSLISKRSKQSVAKEKKTNAAKKATSKSFLGILKRSKSSLSNKSRTSSKEVLPSEEQQGTKNSPKRVEGATKLEETKSGEEPKPCQCATEFIKLARECGHFFLGTTLHEQAMRTLQIMWRS